MEAAVAAVNKSSSSQQQSGDGNTTMEEDDKPKPNPSLEAGKKLPSRFGEFPPELYGKPIEDLDEFYDDKFVSMACKSSKRRGNSYAGITSWRHILSFMQA
jgi:hypothetical protein